MSAHTPGPWTTDGHFIKRGRAILAETFTTKLADAGPDDGPGNARLIAQAPAMLDALRELLDAVPPSIPRSQRTRAAEKAARAILATIEGK